MLCCEIQECPQGRTLHGIPCIQSVSFHLQISRDSSLLGEGNGTPLQYSCLESPMGWRAWWAAVHGVTKSWTRLSDFTFTSHFHALEKAMATLSSVLAWRIPGTGEPGGLPSVGSHRVRHDWSDLAAAEQQFTLQVNSSGHFEVVIWLLSNLSP